MAQLQNLPFVPYVHMVNVANGQKGQGSPLDLLPVITYAAVDVHARQPMAHLVSHYKTTVGFTGDPNGKTLYTRWRQTVRDQMSARNFTNLNTFPDAEFHDIVLGMRRLRPGCDGLATAHAGGNTHLIRAIDESIIQLVRDIGKKFTTSLLLHPPQQPVAGGPVIAPGHLMVDPSLLPPGAPGHWDPTMTAPPGAATASNIPVHSPPSQNLPPADQPVQNPLPPNPPPSNPPPTNPPPSNPPAQNPPLPIPLAKNPAVQIPAPAAVPEWRRTG